MGPTQAKKRKAPTKPRETLVAKNRRLAKEHDEDEAAGHRMQEALFGVNPLKIKETAPRKLNSGGARTSSETNKKDKERRAAGLKENQRKAAASRKRTNSGKNPRYASPGPGATESPTKPAKAPANAKETFRQRFARERTKQGAGGTFTYKGKKFTTDRADDKPANAPRSAKKPAKAPKKKGFFSKLGDKFKKATKLTGKPIKRSFQRGARMTPAERRKYDAAVKSYEEKPVQAKAGGGRVTVKNPVPKGAIKSALGSALGSGGGLSGALSGARQAAKKPIAKKPRAKKPTAKKPMARTSVKKRMPRRP